MAANNIRHNKPSAKALAIGAAAFVALFCVGAWLIIHHNPAARPPLNPNAVRPGIEMVDVKYDRQMSFGLGMIVTISGTIINNTDKELPLPKSIAVALTDNSNQELYRTVLAPSVKTLGGTKACPSRPISTMRQPRPSICRSRWAAAKRRAPDRLT